MVRSRFLRACKERPYQDAEVPGDYTPVGYFEASEEFVSAVENNPVLEGWGNKIVQISAEG